jgi:hypothetical protein
MHVSLSGFGDYFVEQAPEITVIIRHRVSPSASPVTGSSG